MFGLVGGRWEEEQRKGWARLFGCMWLLAVLAVAKVVVAAAVAVALVVGRVGMEMGIVVEVPVPVEFAQAGT